MERKQAKFPNTSLENAITFLDELRAKLRNATYPGIDAKPSVSIGICHVEPESPLTDAEMREKANVAKRFSKDNGKDCISTYAEGGYSDGDLHVVNPGARS